MKKSVIVFVMIFLGVMTVPSISYAETTNEPNFEEATSGIIESLTPEDKAIILELIRATRGNSQTAQGNTTNRNQKTNQPPID